MKKKLIILSSVILLTISINSGQVIKQMSDDVAETNSNFITIEQEKSLELEPWMTNHNIWNCLSCNFDLIKEKKLSIEPWMVNEENWN